MTTAPLLLLHGFAGDAKDWDAVVAHLPGCVVSAQNLFGHGGHAEVVGTTFAAEVDRLASTCHVLGWPRCHVAGYSLGARLALGLSIRHPTLVTRATLIGAQPGLRTEALRAERRQADARWSERLEMEGLDAFFDSWQAQPLFASQALFPELVRRRRSRLREHHSAAGLAHAMRALGVGDMPDLWSALPAITAAVRLVVGATDTKFIALADEMLQRLSSGALEIIAGCGHNPLLERPEALAASLQSHSTARKAS